MNVMDEHAELLAKKAELERQLAEVQEQLARVHGKTTLWCRWCEAAATHMVVEGSKITWVSCPEHRHASYERDGKLVTDPAELAAYDAVWATHRS